MTDNPGSYDRSQQVGEHARKQGHDGLIYDSIRDPGGICVVVYRPSCIRDIAVPAEYRVHVARGSTDVTVTEV